MSNVNIIDGNDDPFQNIPDSDINSENEMDLA